MQRFLKQSVSVLFVLFISMIKLNAQETTAEIQGTITNASVGLAGVTVTATHQPTGTKYVTT